MPEKSKSKLTEDLASIAAYRSEPRRPPADQEQIVGNGLSPAEAERLAVLVEELGEAQQAVGKVLRFGYEATHPDGGPTNRQDLEKELGDVRNAERLLVEAGDLRAAEIQLRAQAKSMTIGQYLNHQPKT